MKMKHEVRFGPGRAGPGEADQDDSQRFILGPSRQYEDSDLDRARLSRLSPTLQKECLLSYAYTHFWVTQQKCKAGVTRKGGVI